jgi:GTP-binding protein
MPGTPIRLFLRSQSDKNPYADKKEKKVTKLNKHQEGRYRKDLKKPVRNKKDS